ncbi:hypothetical protein MXL87_08285 [Klebsiella variicola]|uniref:hypothetical protein n=1 Tax=Klebsiella variicola TaxID=244366 RepID=UPI002DB8C286|nr:hypothetical protein [Klebsiella variicola]MEB6354977.1 hypothetical protein [Klebsiella variicola]
MGINKMNNSPLKYAIKSFAWSLFAFILISCTNNTSNPVGRPMDEDKVNQLSLCAGGMEQGLSADLVAALEKNGGKITSSFTEYAKGLIFSNKDIASSDKAAMYNKYIDCILKMQERQARADSCTLIKDSCMSVANTIFKQCIRKEMKGCYEDCRYRGFNRDACTLQLCNYDKISDDAKEFYNNRCNAKDDYMSQENECAEKYSQCMTSQG